MEKLVSWAKRRGFVFQSSEIYGGIGGIYDFGPYGVELKNNLKKLWWKRFVEDRDDIVGIDSSILMNKKVWEASGHEKGFQDPLVECKKCHKRIRQKQNQKSKIQNLKSQQIPNSKSQNSKFVCPECAGKLTKTRQFNLMFKTFVGPSEDSSSMTYLRPETAQGMFCDFKQVLEVSRQKLPFGIAQIGKSFRNEINTKDYLFRIREFEIAEIEYFIKPDEDEKWFKKWLKEWKDFIFSLGIKKENIIEHKHSKEELSHYSKRTVDLDYKFPFGVKELTGLANRTDFDLKNHEKHSGKDLKYFDEEKREKYWPYVIEPTLGIERVLLAVLFDSFEIISGGRTKTTESAKEEEIILHLNPKLAPIKVAILPLVKKLSSKAREIYQDIKTCYPAEYDEVGTIGRRYRRQDEIGTPYCATVDFETLKDGKVTVRDRDSMKQDRVEIPKLKNYLWKKLEK